MDSIDACIYMLLHSRYIQVKPSDIAAKDGGIMDILSQYVSEPLNLCGINLDEALYFVSSGCPVIAIEGRKPCGYYYGIYTDRCNNI